MNCIVSLILLFVTCLLNVIDLHFFDTIDIVCQTLGLMECDIILGCKLSIPKYGCSSGFSIEFDWVGLMGLEGFRIVGGLLNHRLRFLFGSVIILC